jgi:pimeloyl-ACP methyl ester carboxylesterase
VINGVALYWELIGQGGDPIVLVHGSWGDHHSWDGIAPGDLRGRFESSPTIDGATVKASGPAGKGACGRMLPTWPV